jgi:iron complex outermembrane receptor protein
MVQAQQQPPIEEVVVTGTRIRTTDQGALPVQTITQQQIQQSGATTAEQFLQSVSIAVQGNSNTVAGSGSGATTGGVSSVSLRGLGSQRTLVLINGQRVAGGGTITDSTTVDVNSIPLAALEKVDVLKDSASAIYGSDAIAGVVNFIIRDNYQGAELTGYGGGTSDGGGDVKRINGVVGFGNLASDRFNVLLSANYEKENSLYGWQRSFARSGVNVAAGNDATSGNTFPANFIAADGSFGTHNPQTGACGPSISDPLIDPTGRCRYDPSPFVSLLPPAERYNVYSGVHLALTPDLQLYGSAAYNQNKQEFVIQPVPLSDQFALPSNNPLANQAPYSCGPGCATATVLLAPSSPFYPTAYVKSITGGPTPVLDMRYRSYLTGNRDLTDTSRSPRLTLGLKGTAGAWDFNGGFLYSQTQLTEHDNSGYPLYSQILPLLNSGLVNFFGPNDPTITAQAQAANFVGDAYKTRTTIAEFEASGSRELVRLPAGPLQMAVDTSFRKEKFETTPSAAIAAEDIAGYGANFTAQTSQRNVLGAALEFQVPILKALTASPAVRYDHYEGTGGKTTPKIGLRWRPLDELLVRGSYGKGFRAPSLTEMFQPTGLGTSAPGLSDPARCPITGSSTDCNTQFNTMVGGNALLRPETSDTYTLGFVVEPMRDFSIGVDGFSIKLTNTIIFGVNPATIFADPTVYGNLITRGAPTTNCPGCPGPITSINQTNANFGETDVKGYDFDMRYHTPVTPLGKFTFSLVGSYFATYRIQQPDMTFLNVAGLVSPITNGNGGVIPRWHHFATLAWSRGPFELAASQNYQSSYEDLPSSVTGALRNVSSYSTLDLQGGYTPIEHVRIAVGARNALNKAPPYSNVGGQNFFQAGYDPGYADPRGRFMYGTVTYSFAGL